MPDTLNLTGWVVSHGRDSRLRHLCRASSEEPPRRAYMELKEPPDPERLRVIPVVRYSVERRIAGGKADYWDWATLLEIEVLGRNQEGAETALGEALACIRELFEPETTARNLRLIREARERRGDEVDWAQAIENELMKPVSAKG